MNHKPIILGAFENVSFPRFNIGEVTAKIDTGAFTGALHCTKIEIVEAENNKILQFSPFDHPEITIQADDFIVRYVKSSNGLAQKRYFITTDIMIRDSTYPVVLSLADRSEMKWPVLIGRKFLRSNNFLVDVTQGSTYRYQVKD